MIRLEIGLEMRHGGVMRVCVTEDKTAAVFQEIPFVSRPWVVKIFCLVQHKSSEHVMGPWSDDIVRSFCIKINLTRIILQ